MREEHKAKIDELLGKMSALEQELKKEFESTANDFKYTVEKKKIDFEIEARKKHKELVSRWNNYVYDSGFWVVLTIPFIWLPVIPALLLDVAVWLYQLVCFPVYGIPRVRRRDYVIIDRPSLQYLNFIEKANCFYCGYFNGLISFIREVAGRTEQYWCPIRHARPVISVHSRYKHFFEYGDAEGYRKGLAEVRKQFKDCKK